jgi:hypothetical protein
MARTPKTLAVWKRRAADYAGTMLAKADLFSDADPYLVADQAEEAFENEETPSQFVRRVFAADFEALPEILAAEAEDFFGERASA